MIKIPFNKPYITGTEITYVQEAIVSGKLSGDGSFTKKCHQFFEQKYGFTKVLLTTSCTDALELAAILLNIKDGDEVIMPSYTFVSTANAFVLRGAKIIFADSLLNHPNIDVSKVESLITQKTIAIVPVHYGGVACEMDELIAIANKYNLFVIEDAAQAIDSFYKGKPLGSFGHLAAFSFHDTKNIICGEGGMLVVNDAQFVKRAEIVREKGTNRSAFFRGEVDKYGWVDMGSSFLLSDILAAFLWGQLLEMEVIQTKRKKLWHIYYEKLSKISTRIIIPQLNTNQTNNAHAFYIICKNLDERNSLIAYLKDKGIAAVFHYVSLHKSVFYADIHGNNPLPACEKFSDCLLRLPLFADLNENCVNEVCQAIIDFYQ